MSDRFQPQAGSGGGGGGAGIDGLTQDVLAGPGPGAVPATVVGLRTRPVDNAAPSLGDVLTWDGLQWTPYATQGALRTLYEIDFTAQLPIDIKTAVGGTHGTQLIDGKTWHFFGLNNVVSCDLGANGIRIQRSDASSQDAGGCILIESLIGGADLADKRVVVMARVDWVTTNAFYQYGNVNVLEDGVIVNDAPTGSLYVQTGHQYRDTGDCIVAQHGNFGAGTVADNQTTYPTDDVFALDFSPGLKSVRFLSGLWGGEWPDLEDLQVRYDTANSRKMPLTSRLDPLKLLLSLATLNSSGNALVVDYKGLRVLA